MRRAAGRGFTLLELLTVTAIVAVLAVIGLVNLSAARTRSQLSRAKNGLRTTAAALEAYAVDQRGYPPQFWPVERTGSGVYTDNFPTLFLLTSPVAYLTSGGALVDPFVPEKEHRFVGIRLPYGYWNFASQIAIWEGVGQGSPPVVRFARQGMDEHGEWLLGSWGPDQEGQLVWGGIREEEAPSASGRPGWHRFVYDPTNGVTSAGEIFRSRKRGQI